MALYERLLGRNDLGVEVPGKISVHQFSGLFRLVARGLLTGQQAQDAVASISSGPLSAPEVIEAQTLIATITNITETVPVNLGSLNVNVRPVIVRLMRMERAHVIDDALVLGEANATGFQTPAQVKTFLGV